ncbi:TerB family tellurite resistance protein [Alteromonas facilis]|uniref:tellurite resistance TerB family protein n=1 Tax=Alteromonas facilis TaxID=2048004 RepID=UPI000C29424E|nr:TerB family tellurite resistance protein [Alteromonas facilis]
MIKSFLAIFQQYAEQAPSDQHTLELATAALMFEVVRADNVADEAEKNYVKAALKDRFSLSDEELSALSQDGQRHAEEAVDLVQFTRVLNNHFDLSQRAKFIQQLWELANTDERIDMHEEHAIRRISELMYVPHSMYVQAKLNAL